MHDIFEEQVARKPDHYPWAQDFIDAMWKGHWTPNEFTFSSDRQDFLVSLTEEEQRIIVNTLSAIGQIEIAVKKFWARLGDNLPHPSLSDLGYVMAGVEVIHNQAYEKLLKVLQLQDVFEENLKLDIIKGRVEYLSKHNKRVYRNNRKQYIYSLILFTLFVENVSLFSQLYIVSWFNRFKNVLKDSAQQVQYTRLEETLHAQVGIKLIKTIRKEHPELFDNELIERVGEEIQEAFKYESKIIDWIVGEYDQPNLNADILKEYIKNRLNDSVRAIGFKKAFKIDKVLLEKSEWMDEETLGNEMTDFFVKTPTGYSKSAHSFNEGDLFDD